MPSRLNTRSAVMNGTPGMFGSTVPTTSRRELPYCSAGRAALVTPLALAAAACGADGVMAEMHPDPLHARCDGAQALLPEGLAALSQRLHAVREACR